MATLREIRRRISSVRSTQQITKAMKMVAAAKLRRAQENILATRPYAQKLSETMSHVISRMELRTTPLLVERPVEKVLVVVITADRGLCGAFNSNLIRFAAAQIASYKDVEVQLFTVGRKGYDYFSKRNYTLSGHKINFFNHLNFEDALHVSEHLRRAYENTEYDRIEIVYNEFKSAVQQKIVTEQYLPFLPDDEMLQESSRIDFLYEPDKAIILPELISKALNIKIWKVLLESNAAEQGARMTAMESATDNAEELIDTLTLHYNRARQAAITKEISEIVGGAEALKEK
jgi:F-type H+-transporting ATPase subunit gamma